MEKAPGVSNAAQQVTFSIPKSLAAIQHADNLDPDDQLFDALLRQLASLYRTKVRELKTRHTEQGKSGWTDPTCIGEANKLSGTFAGHKLEPLTPDPNLAFQKLREATQIHDQITEMKVDLPCVPAHPYEVVNSNGSKECKENDISEISSIPPGHSEQCDDHSACGDHLSVLGDKPGATGRRIYSKSKSKSNCSEQSDQNSALGDKTAASGLRMCSKSPCSEQGDHNSVLGDKSMVSALRMYSKSAASEQGSATSGQHVSFKTSKSGISVNTSSSDEPLPLRSDWVKNNRKMKRLTSSLTLADTMRSLAMDQLSANQSTDSTELTQIAETYDGPLKRFVAYPGSRTRVAWDLFGAVLIFWDLMIIPLNISGLAPTDSMFLISMDWITLIFWTLNMPASLMVGFVKSGVTEMNPRKIFLNYMKTWFVLDVIVVLPDWIFTIVSLASSTDNSSEAGDSVKLLRILRLVRCMRLLRLAKLKWILQSLNDLINSEYTSIIANIFKMIIALVAVNHFIGCMWFLIADVNTDGKNWVMVHNFDQSGWTYKYVTSFHWSITQFTPSSMHVQPQNVGERTFAITVVVFGLVGFSYLVGSITGSLTELRRMNSDASKQFWKLRRYMNQNHVPKELYVRILKYLEHQWQLQTVNVPHNSVTILKLLSEQLNSELNWAIAVPNMLIHPLFNYLNEISLVTMQRLATGAISRKMLASGDSLFWPFETATDMSFVVSGKLQYIYVNQPKSELVDQGEDWIAEPVLWTDSWHHRGQLIAVHPCDLLLVNAISFVGIVKRNPQVDAFVSGYASNFIQWISSKPRGEISDIVQGDLISDEIRSLMPLERDKSTQTDKKNGWTFLH